VKKTEFIHLHVHSSYSIGQSVLKIDELIETCKKNKIHYAALTDLNNLYGAVHFYFKALDNGIKPVIGCEITFDEGNLVLLCKDEKGFSNIIYLLNRKNREEKISVSLLYENSQGLIVLSGYENSKTTQLLNSDKLPELEDWLIFNKEKFGKNFYVEINTAYAENTKSSMHILEGIAENLGIETILTNTVNYQISPHHKLLDAFKCILNGDNYYSTEREQVYNNQEYFKSSEEMRIEGFERAYLNTGDVAFKCNLLLEKAARLPEYKIPESFNNADEYLLYLTSKNLEEKYGENNQQARDRLNRELKVINKLKFSDYFLIVWDIVNYAHKNNITIGPGRGSAVASIVSYLLNITDIDPLEHNLLFERFLNEHRIEMPDIDIDVCSEKRDKLINYVRNHFGKDKVASIISFGTFKSSGAIRDTGKSLGVSEAVIENILSNIDKRVSIEKNLKKNHILKNLMKSSHDIKKVLIGAQKLEGIVKNISQHAAGIVIYPENMERNIPCIVNDDKLITQWDKDSLEKLGIIKIDLLSLKTLTTINNIKKRARLKNFEHNFEDREIFEMISNGKTIGVFQFETPNMTKYAMYMKPENFKELCILSALARPGAKDNISYFSEGSSVDFDWQKNPEVKKILEETRGVIVYQEQIMELASEVAGMDMFEADDFRKAISKKNIYLMQDLKEKFIQKGKKKKQDEKFLEELFSHIEKFAGYGFNKAHAVAYTAISYRCAWLKKKYPFAFYAEILNSDIDNIEKIYFIIKEMKENNVKILPPHLIKSKSRFVGSSKGIRFAFSGIKGIGASQGRQLEDFVKASGNKIRDFDEFILKIKNSKIHENVIKALIFTGTCDYFGVSRKYMIENMNTDFNFNSLFENNNNSPARKNTEAEYDEIYLRTKEREYMGVSFTRAVLDDYILTIKLLSDENIMEAKRIKNRAVNVAGVVKETGEDFFDDKRIPYIILEDYLDTVKLRIDDKHSAEMKVNSIIKCSITDNGEGFELKNFTEIKDVFADPGLKLAVKLEDMSVIEDLRKVFDIYQGIHEIILIVNTEEGKVMLSTEHLVDINESFLEEIEELVGIENMALRRGGDS